MRDDNYSDDELLMLPLYSALVNAPHHDTITPAMLEALRTAYDAELSDERSALWGAIFLAAGGARDDEEKERVLTGSVIWGLRTWPLELIDWPVYNQERLDLQWRGQGEKTRSRRVLPANERRQYRWNADPWEVTDGGNGLREADAGGWLLPYWLARYHGLIGEDT